MRGYTGGTKAKPRPSSSTSSAQGAAAAAGSKPLDQLQLRHGRVQLLLAVDSNERQARPRSRQGRHGPDVSGRHAGRRPDREAGRPRSTPSTTARSPSRGSTRTADGLEFRWHTENPTAYPTYVHIGIPPVIGSDGIIYGLYESPHLADTPITPAGQSADWTTEVAVPKDVTGLYILRERRVKAAEELRQPCHRHHRPRSLGE